MLLPKANIYVHLLDSIPTMMFQEFFEIIPIDIRTSANIKNEILTLTYTSQVLPSFKFAPQQSLLGVHWTPLFLFLPFPPQPTPIRLPPCHATKSRSSVTSNLPHLPLNLCPIFGY